MKTRNIIQQYGSDLIADMELGVFEIETGQYIVIKYNDYGRLIEFYDRKEFASYMINIISEFLEENSDYEINNNRDLKLVLAFSKMLAGSTSISITQVKSTNVFEDVLGLEIVEK
ncbi:hypothetical protein ACIFOT_04695 [Neobacillus sp. NRS-1170]|uniref:hypothetical protein n=1 Tax=Neobacillus sp. NRS-1170 TaxID=3233898 RepID=UPI003D2ABC8F